MTAAEAEALTARLLAPWPYAQQNMTMAVYVDRVKLLPDYDTALEAINGLLDSCKQVPAIAAVVEAYNDVNAQKVAYRGARPQLDWPSLTEEQIAENRRRVRIVVDLAAKRIDLDSALERMNG